jgi:ADP-ribose pyrophosphatase YjhB (NUDIX family)
MSKFRNIEQRPSVSVDSILATEISLLLVKERTKHREYWALPGGSVKN